jgi:hypothetical protein
MNDINPDLGIILDQSGSMDDPYVTDVERKKQIVNDIIDRLKGENVQTDGDDGVRVVQFDTPPIPVTLTDGGIASVPALQELMDTINSLPVPNVTFHVTLTVRDPQPAPDEITTLPDEVPAEEEE